MRGNSELRRSLSVVPNAQNSTIFLHDLSLRSAAPNARRESIRMKRTGVLKKAQDVAIQR